MTAPERLVEGTALFCAECQQKVLVARNVAGEAVVLDMPPSKALVMQRSEEGGVVAVRRETWQEHGCTEVTIEGA